MKNPFEIWLKSFHGASLLLVSAALFGRAADGAILASCVTTITNSTPVSRESFGSSVAWADENLLLVGTRTESRPSTNSGSVYLVDSNGQIRKRILSPAAGKGDNFGSSVAVLNSDLVLVGAPYDSSVSEGSGSASLFSLSGGLSVSFTNPAPANSVFFGSAVAAYGTDRVLIGAPNARSGHLAPGAAYLYSVSGELLSTFFNPTPANGENFGGSILAVGTDRVLVGASSDYLGESKVGAAYLFGTNGVFLMKIANPIPAPDDAFGCSLAALGENVFAIGASGAKVGGVRTGAAFLFASDGSVIASITNPAPQSNDFFGHSMVGLGSSRLLVGAPGAGSAYLFSTNGALLAVFESPRKPYRDWFGWALATFRNDRVAIGTADEYGGAVYLYSIPRPSLSVSWTPSSVSISWAWPEPGLILQQAGLLGDLADWQDASEAVSVTGTTNVVQQSLVATNRFYRLRRP